MSLNSSNNYSYPQQAAQVNVTVPDISVNVTEKAKNYARYAIGDDPQRWESLKRKVIPLASLATSEDPSQVEFFEHLQAEYNIHRPLNRKLWAGTDAVSPATTKMGDALVVVHVVNKSAKNGYIDRSKANHEAPPWDTWEGGKSWRYFNANKRHNVINVAHETNKTTMLHNIALSFYDYNERLPYFNMPLIYSLYHPRPTTDQWGAIPVDATIDQWDFKNKLTTHYGTLADLHQYAVVPNAFEEEFGAEYHDTGLCDGFVVGIMECTGGVALTERAQDSLKHGAYYPSDTLQGFGEVASINGIEYIPLNITSEDNFAKNPYFISNYTTAHYPYHLLYGGNALFSNILSMETQDFLLQSGVRSSVKHGALPSDIMPNYFKMTVYDVTNPASPVAITDLNPEQFYYSVAKDAQAGNTLWLQSTNELDVEIPSTVTAIDIVIEGLGWFCGLPIYNPTRVFDNETITTQTEQDRVDLMQNVFSKYPSVPVTMPMQGEVDLRYIDIATETTNNEVVGG